MDVENRIINLETQLQTLQSRPTRLQSGLFSLLFSALVSLILFLNFYGTIQSQNAKLLHMQHQIEKLASPDSTTGCHVNCVTQSEMSMHLADYARKQECFIAQPGKDSSLDLQWNLTSIVNQHWRNHLEVKSNYIQVLEEELESSSLVASQLGIEISRPDCFETVYIHFNSMPCTIMRDIRDMRLEREEYAKMKILREIDVLVAFESLINNSTQPTHIGLNEQLVEDVRTMKSELKTEVDERKKDFKLVSDGLKTEGGERKKDVQLVRDGLKTEVNERKKDVQSARDELKTEIDERKKDVKLVRDGLKTEVNERKKDVQLVRDGLKTEVDDRKKDVKLVRDELKTEVDACIVVSARNGLNTEVNITRNVTAAVPSAGLVEEARPVGCFSAEGFFLDREYVGGSAGANYSLALAHAKTHNKMYFAMAKKFSQGHVFSFSGFDVKRLVNAKHGLMLGGGCENPCADRPNMACGCSDETCTGGTPDGEENNRRWAVYRVIGA